MTESNKNLSVRCSHKPNNINLNQHWKSLDAIFQTQLRKFVLTENRKKFKSLAKELGFNDTQNEFLFDSILAFSEQFRSSPTLNRYNRNHTNNHHNNQNHGTTNNSTQNKQNKTYFNFKPPKRSLYSTLHQNKERPWTSSCSSKDIIDPSKSTPKTSLFSTSKRLKSSSISNTKRKLNDDKDKHQQKQEESENEEYIVDGIVDHRKIGNKTYEYCVKWAGYADTTWEPQDNLTTITIKQYCKDKGLRINKNGEIKKSKKNKKEDEIDSLKLFVCKSCNKTFRTGKGLSSHVRKKHSKTQLNTMSPYWEDSQDTDSA